MPKKVKLSDEAKEDIRRDCTRLLVELVEMIFTEAVKATAFEVGEPWTAYGLDREITDIAGTIGKAVGEKARKTFERELRAQVYKEMLSTLDYLKSEAFIDKVIDRINRKQLAGGKQ